MYALVEKSEKKFHLNKEKFVIRKMKRKSRVQRYGKIAHISGKDTTSNTENKVRLPPLSYMYFTGFTRNFYKITIFAKINIFI